MANKTFKKIYEDISSVPPKKAFVTRIAVVTHKSESTVRMWLCGRQRPDELTRLAIAKELKTDADSLFPEVEQSKC